jgi:hypothetical protein
LQRPVAGAFFCFRGKLSFAPLAVGASVKKTSPQTPLSLHRANVRKDGFAEQARNARAGPVEKTARGKTCAKTGTADSKRLLLTAQ